MYQTLCSLFDSWISLFGYSTHQHLIIFIWIAYSIVSGVVALAARGNAKAITVRPSLTIAYWVVFVFSLFYCYQISSWSRILFSGLFCFLVTLIVLIVNDRKVSRLRRKTDQLCEGVSHA